VGPFPIALLLVAAVSWYHFLFGGFSVHGSVIDQATGQPIVGARVWSAHANTASLADGSFVLDYMKPPEMIGVDAPGYRAATQRLSSPFELLPLRLEAIAVDIEVADAGSGAPVSAVLDGPVPTSPLSQGTLRVAPVQPGQEFNLNAEGYLPGRATYTGQDVLRVALQPRLDGRVTDAATGRGVPNARLSLGDMVLSTDGEGGFELNHRPTSGVLQVLAPGY